MRTSDSVKVLNYVFNNFSNINIESIINESFINCQKYFQNNINIKKATDTAILTMNNIGNTIFPLSKNEYSNLKIETYILNSLKAPIYENTKLGFLTIKSGDEILKIIDIYTKNNIRKKDFKIYYKELLKKYI